MQKLKSANLYHSELIPINGKLVERYNQCLVKMGFTPTQLTSFSIDGLGWSPEIAEEKKDTHYLSNGESNQHAIIITPLQYNKPVFFPFHTFDRDLMLEIFKVHGQRINDITRDCAICVDFDQGIDAFYEPLDVLKYDKISVNFRLINDLDVKQKEQFQLIEQFKTGHNFIDEKLHQQLLQSAKTYGDLRDRKLTLHSLNFTTDSFYTKAFGGVYVLRDFITPIVVFEDDKWYKEAIKDTTYDVLIYHISQPELMDKLRDHVIVEYDLEESVKTDRYDRVKKWVFSQALSNVQHPIKDILNDTMLFKSYLNKLDIETRKEIMSVEIYLEKLEVSNQFKIADVVAPQLFTALHEPHSSLENKHKDLIWQLLVNIAPIDVLHLYWYDKEQFYTAYNTWDDSLKEWAIETINRHIR